MSVEQQNVLAICDQEIDYLQQMTDYLRSYQDLLFEVHPYSNVHSMAEEFEPSRIALLIVAENLFGNDVKDLGVEQLILLNESGRIYQQDIKNIDKYQRADKVCQEILSFYLHTQKQELAPRIRSTLGEEAIGRLIGMYSPIRRCLQTSFALTLGQILALTHKTIYLNFEHYAGIDELTPDVQTRDLSDLLYILSTGEDRFRLWIQSIVQKKGELDYIPPMKVGTNLLHVTTQDWMKLIHRIIQSGDYEYVILDLSENMQGLYDILRYCKIVFTLTKDDRIAKNKMIQYEHALQVLEYDDVLSKTHKCSLPLFRQLPMFVEQYTKGDLADYMKGLIQELEVFS
ncbi:MAG: hypothetical protein LBM60_08530 [Clostridium sp.]|nr:hypothetical protein [Clostridium sp.]